MPATEYVPGWLGVTETDRGGGTHGPDPLGASAARRKGPRKNKRPVPG
ncbi:MAG: hypothetical protein ACREAQ_02140 [Nitrososphaera sp.]